MQPLNQSANRVPSSLSHCPEETKTAVYDLYDLWTDKSLQDLFAKMKNALSGFNSRITDAYLRQG